MLPHALTHTHAHTHAHTHTHTHAAQVITTHAQIRSVHALFFSPKDTFSLCQLDIFPHTVQQTADYITIRQNELSTQLYFNIYTDYASFLPHPPLWAHQGNPFNSVLQRPQATQGSMPQEHYVLKRPDNGSWLEEHYVLERPDTWIMAWRALCSWEARYMDHGSKSIMFLRGPIHGSWLEEHYVLERPATWIMARRALCSSEARYMDHGSKSIMFFRGPLHGSWLEDHYVLQRPDTWIMAWRA